MSLEALLARLQSEQSEAVMAPATPATPSANQVLQREPLQHKAATPATPETPQNNDGRMRRKVLADLRHHPSIRYAAEVDASGDPVRIMLAVRDVGSCILEVDAQRWNLEGFIALMDRQAGLRQEVAA